MIMLIRFSVEIYMSFRERQIFFMSAGKSSTHPSHIIHSFFVIFNRVFEIYTCFQPLCDDQIVLCFHRQVSPDLRSVNAGSRMLSSP